MCFITILLRKCEEVKRVARARGATRKGEGRGQEAQGDCAEQPQIWLRLGSALLFIFRLKSAQQQRSEVGQAQLLSLCCLVLPGTWASRMRGLQLKFCCCFSRVRLMWYLWPTVSSDLPRQGRPGRSQRALSGHLNPPWGQVHHFAELKTVSYKCDLTTSYAALGEARKGCCLPPLKDHKWPTKNAPCAVQLTKARRK